MAVETGSWISDLVPAQPTGTSVVSEGAGHLRIIKSVLQLSFPNVNDDVNAIHTKATAPTSTSAGLLWFDTTADELKIRNEADSAWITLGIDPTTNYGILGSKPVKAVTHAIQSASSTLRSGSYVDTGFAITHDKQSATSTLYIYAGFHSSTFTSFDTVSSYKSYIKLANTSGTLITGTTDNLLIADIKEAGMETSSTAELGFGYSRIWKVTAANCPDGTSGNNTFDIWNKQTNADDGGTGFNNGVMFVMEIEE